MKGLKEILAETVASENLIVCLPGEDEKRAIACNRWAKREVIAAPSRYVILCSDYAESKTGSRDGLNE